MKIYEIGTGYTPIPAQVAAATESVVEELTKAFLAQNVDVEIVDIGASNRAPHNLPITEVKVPSVFTRSDVSLGIVHKLKRVVYSVALAFKLKKLLKASDEKVVLHFHNQYNMFFFVKLVSKKLRAKAVTAYTNHNGFWNMPWEEAEGTLKKRYFQEITSRKEADISFVLNAKTKENVVSHLGVPAERVLQIDNGVNTQIYCPLAQEKVAEIKEKYGLTGKRVILQVGSVNENKGQGRSLKLLEPLLREHEDLVFAYVGGIVSQEYFDEVKNLTEELGLEDQVRYLGAVSPGEEMNELYNIACATVFSSRYESFGLVCIESLSAGVPVLICSDSLLDFGEGCVVCTAENISDRVNAQILSNEAHALLAGKARQNAEENFTWAKIARDYHRGVQ
jgi:glycosyltransferase involved in cell wall biosynthesis